MEETAGWVINGSACHLCTILVYGSAPDDIFRHYADHGILIIPFESEFSKSRKRVTA